MYYLDKELIEQICHPLALKYFDNVPDDPIPPFHPHRNDRLEASLAAPAMEMGGKDVYDTIELKAAMLFYLICQNHAFSNGNKRIATASLLVFLSINDYWLEADEKELAEWGIKISSSGENIPPLKMDDIIPELTLWIKNHLVIDK